LKKCTSAERKKNRAAHCQYMQPGKMSFRSPHVSADASALFRRLSTPAWRRAAGAVETFEEDYLRVVTMPNILRRIAQHTETAGHNDRPCPTRPGILQTGAGARIKNLSIYLPPVQPPGCTRPDASACLVSVSFLTGRRLPKYRVCTHNLSFFSAAVIPVTGRRYHLAKRRSLNNQAHTLTHTTLIPHIPFLPILTILCHSWPAKSIVFSRDTDFSKKKHLMLPILLLLRPHSDLSPVYSCVYDSVSTGWRGQFLPRPAAGRVIR
jgi:hypothetical protein